MAGLRISFPIPGDFAQKGYLGNEIRDLLPKVREAHKDAFDFFYELNEYSQKLFTETTDASSKSKQESLAISFFAKILEGAQAACILSNHGLASDARTVLRSVLNTLFLLRKTVTEPGFEKRYFNADDWRRLTRMKEYFRREHDHKTADSIQGKIIEDGLKKLESIEKIATSADVGMGTQYGLYRILSDDAHGNLPSLQRPALPNGDLNWGPLFNYASTDVLVGSYFLLVALMELERLFDLKSEGKLQAFRERHAALVPKHFSS